MIFYELSPNSFVEPVLNCNRSTKKTFLNNNFIMGQAGVVHPVGSAQDFIGLEIGRPTLLPKCKLFKPTKFYVFHVQQALRTCYFLWALHSTNWFDHKVRAAYGMWNSQVQGLFDIITFKPRLLQQRPTSYCVIARIPSPLIKLTVLLKRYIQLECILSQFLKVNSQFSLNI